MTTTIEQANEALRTAIEARREAQAAGRPHEEWYGDRVAGTSRERHIAADLLHDATRGPSAAEVIARFAPERPGSLAFLELLEELRRLHLSKSQDYGSESDPLANIRQGADLVNIEPWRGCMVRIGDKIQRLRTYCRTGHLAHEGVRDSFLDLAAYSLLAIVLLDEEKRDA
jgi:hypothetical protein